MNSTTRIFVYLGGFIIGMMLVSIIMTRRSAKENSSVDPWAQHNQQMLDAGAEPLPPAVPESIRAGLVVDFAQIPTADAPKQAVWLLNFKKSYPYVLVVHELASDELQYMAADQISINLAEGVDVTELKPMLDELGLRLRMFNRKESLAIIGVLSTELDTVPATIEAVQPWSHLFTSAEPDYIQFKARQPGE